MLDFPAFGISAQMSRSQIERCARLHFCYTFAPVPQPELRGSMPDSSLQLESLQFFGSLRVLMQKGPLVPTSGLQLVGI